MHDPNYPPSPGYLARQAQRQKTLDAERERLTWTDAQYLAERDVAYVAEQRSYVKPRIRSLEQEIADDTDIEGYVRHYGTDEG